MKTYIVILILIAITHVIFIKLTKRSTSLVKKSKPKRTVIPEGNRTPEEIVDGRPFLEVYEELSAIASFLRWFCSVRVWFASRITIAERG